MDYPFHQSGSHSLTNPDRENPELSEFRVRDRLSVNYYLSNNSEDIDLASRF